jgi:hypothetical protein
MDFDWPIFLHLKTKINLVFLVLVILPVHYIARSESLLLLRTETRQSVGHSLSTVQAQEVLSAVSGEGKTPTFEEKGAEFLPQKPFYESVGHDKAA